jgi:Right handed beta helix region
MHSFWISRRRNNRAIRRLRGRCRPLLEDLEGRQLLSQTFTVMNAKSSGTGSLAQAISDSNNAPSSTPNIIQFEIGSSGANETITITSPLTISQSVVLNGFTQSEGASAPPIELKGSSVSIGLDITASNTTIEGLSIVDFTSDGVQINSASGDLITDNYVGITTSGGNGGNGGNGITILGSSSDNTIGGTVSGAGNTISENVGNGVYITGGSSGNLLEKNHIGTDAGGTNSLPNGQNGVLIDDSSPDDTIGGTVSGAGNLISANMGNGIEITGDSSGTLVSKNRIGTNADGDDNDAGTMANDNDGVYITGGSTDNTIGGTASGIYNVISGNNNYGVDIDDGSSGNLVEGNRIGTAANGTKGNVDLGNGLSGVLIKDSSTNDNTIGGTASGAGNLISDNKSEGVDIVEATGNYVQGNLIGIQLDSTDPLGGTQTLPNLLTGVLVHESADSNTIGGIGSAGNMIVGNDHSGVEFASGASYNVLEGNLIGINANGIAVPNKQDGVVITGSTVSGTTSIGNIIGGNATGAGNTISGNVEEGVSLEILSSDTVLEGNWIGIGTKNGGTVRVPNGYSGVLVDNTSGNMIGGTITGAGNVISGNSGDGVHITNGSPDNFVEGNFIGTNSAGAHLYNGDNGVEIDASTGNTVGGTVSGAGNTISHNHWNGVEIMSKATDNLVEGNVIDSNGSGGSLTGEQNGVYIDGSSASDNTIGGTAAGAGNQISHNTYNGVFLNHTGAGNVVEDDQIDHDGNDGVEVNFAPSTSVLGCTIEYDPGYGIFVNDSTNFDDGSPKNTLKHDGHNNEIKIQQ